eukprot:COSAG02_NODE_6076_length_3817_cov_1.652501_7_plen_37_part_00
MIVSQAMEVGRDTDVLIKKMMCGATDIRELPAARFI